MPIYHGPQVPQQSKLWHLLWDLLGSAAKAWLKVRTRDSLAGCWSHTDSVTMGAQLVITNHMQCLQAGLGWYLLQPSVEYEWHSPWYLLVFMWLWAVLAAKGFFENSSGTPLIVPQTRKAQVGGSLSAEWINSPTECCRHTAADLPRWTRSKSHKASGRQEPMLSG